jgi:hypothetical protein
LGSVVVAVTGIQIVTATDMSDIVARGADAGMVGLSPSGRHNWPIVMPARL